MLPENIIAREILSNVHFDGALPFDVSSAFAQRRSDMEEFLRLLKSARDEANKITSDDIDMQALIFELDTMIDNVEDVLARKQ